MHETRPIIVVTLLLASFSAGAVSMAEYGEPPQHERRHVLSFNEKLHTIAPLFEVAGKPMADAAVHVAYKYRLPMAIEHVSRDALQEPLYVKLKDQSIRQVITAIVGMAPGYRVDFSHGLVDIYSPAARHDSSSPFNMVIHHFEVNGLDTHFAGAELLCDISRQLHGHSGCGGSIASGQWGDRKITLDLKDKRVYEILNAIVAQNGEALWTPVARPKVSSPLIAGNFWYIYPLDPSFEMSAIGGLQQLVPPQRHAP